MPLTMNELLLVFVVIIVGVGGQIWLSTRKHFWLGLLLPILSFAYSLYAVPTSSIYEGLSTYYKAGLYMQENLLTVGLLIIFGICQWRMYVKKQN
ncbi:hypothetical protein ACHB4O_002424 [Listeria innocua]|uniref:hypothetical protein n=1 Tax=Enterococcus lactis TaxID=357441 RepID=UPI00237BC9EF|nr:hypothetical protein [Enterococcus lactis]EKD8217462.1 hypothetical protein [Listeria innocua]